MPGITRRPAASITSAAEVVGSRSGPTAVMRPSATRTSPAGRSPRSGSTVTTWPPFISSSFDMISPVQLYVSDQRRRGPVQDLLAPSPLPGDTHLLPKAAVQVEVVALGLAGGGVADVGVQRVPVVGELAGPAGPGDRADPAGQTGAGRGSAGDRWPVRGAAAVAFRRGRGVRGKRVEGEALGVG